MITRNEEIFDSKLKETVESVLKKTKKKSEVPEVKEAVST
jgi:hypothetical protein